MVELLAVVRNKVLVAQLGWFYLNLLVVETFLTQIYPIGQHQRAEVATCGEMWQQTGEEAEVEVVGIEGEVVVVEVVVEVVREGIVAGRVDTTAPHTMMINDEHPAGVVGLPWVVAEHPAVAQVSHNISFALEGI